MEVGGGGGRTRIDGLAQNILDAAYKSGSGSSIIWIWFRIPQHLHCSIAFGLGAAAKSSFSLCLAPFGTTMCSHLTTTSVPASSIRPGHILRTCWSLFPLHSQAPNSFRTAKIYSQVCFSTSQLPLPWLGSFAHCHSPSRVSRPSPSSSPPSQHFQHFTLLASSLGQGSVSPPLT